MIKRLLELRNSIEELGVFSPEFHLSTAIWSSLNKLLSVLEGPYAVTLKLQADDLTSGVFMKEWCFLKHTLRGKQTSLALEILRAMVKKHKSLYFKTNSFWLEFLLMQDTVFCFLKSMLNLQKMDH